MTSTGWYLCRRIIVMLSSATPKYSIFIYRTYVSSSRFDEAITFYHQALALQPNSSFCAEMLNRAFTDAVTFKSLAHEPTPVPVHS